MHNCASRRQVLRWGTVVTAVGIAGCSHDALSGVDNPVSDVIGGNGGGGGPQSPTGSGTDSQSTGTPPAHPVATLTPGTSGSSGSSDGDGSPTLAAGDGDEADEFGAAIALAGSTAVIGAPGDEASRGDAAGTAYVFAQANGSWSQQATLTPADGDEGDQFGRAVALADDGTTALVGAPRDEDPHGENAGSAYVFAQSDGGWAQQATLTAGDGDGGDVFGQAVTLGDGGDTALVGAPFDEDPNGAAAGAVYAFTRADGGWSQQAKLTPEDGDDGDVFGGSVTLAGGTALVGAYWDEDPHESRAGSVYVFERSDGTWTQQAKLAAPNGDSNDEFGWAGDVESGTSLVGAPRDEDPNGGEAGAAVVFEGGDGGWSQQATLTASDGDTFDRFGSAVALAGDRALMGAPRDEHPHGDSAGAAYLFERVNGDWTQAGKLVTTDGDPDDVFGSAVGLHGDIALVGAPRDEDPNGPAAGAVYVFQV